jgi:hypothetical protein
MFRVSVGLPPAEGNDGTRGDTLRRAAEVARERGFPIEIMAEVRGA